MGHGVDKPPMPTMRMLALPVRYPSLILLLFVVMVGGAVLGASPAWGVAWLGEERAFALTLIGIALFLPAFGALCGFTRCEGCGYKLFWHAVSKRPHTDSIGWLFTASTCPACGHSRHALSGECGTAE